MLFSSRALTTDIGKRPFITAGFTAFVLMLTLAITSTQGWIRRLGGRRWQVLHRLVYLSAVAGVVHFWWLVKADTARFAGRAGQRYLWPVARHLRRRSYAVTDTGRKRAHNEDAFLADDAPGYAAAVDAAIDEARRPRNPQVSFLTAPSDPELLTLKAHRKLQEADCIVHDRGADPRILDYARRDAARVAVEAAAPDLLLREAAQGRHVVRLRSEASRLVASSARELAVLAAAGIAVDIVAGPLPEGTGIERRAA